MNVDDLISELEDLCGDLSDNKNGKKPTSIPSTSQGSSSTFQSSSYSGYSAQNTGGNQNKVQATSNKQQSHFDDDDEDEDYFKPTSKPTQPQYQPEIRQQEVNIPQKQSSGNQNKGNDNIDDLLDFLQGEDYSVQKGSKPSQAQQSYSPSTTQSTQPKQNLKQTTCLNPYLCNGDGDYANDEYNMKKRVCNALRCSLCNIVITKLVNYKWADDVDLLFFRNNFSRKEKLLTKAISDSSYSSYSCQCRGTSVNKLSTLTEGNVKEWRCVGHFD